MVKEDTLPIEMGRLVLEPLKIKGVDDEACNNTQLHRRVLTRTSIHNPKCLCLRLKTDSKGSGICKRKQKILKEPILKLLHDSKLEKPQLLVNKNNNTVKLMNSPTDTLCALVDNCVQLRISTGSEKYVKPRADVLHYEKNKWWLKSHSNKSREKVIEINHPGPSCSQEALNPPCDVTIDELASYFETLVHIPKKMSSMAEMMYI